MPNYILTEKMQSNKSILHMKKCEDEFESIEIDWRKEATLAEVKDFFELNKIDNADDVQNSMGRTLLFNVVAYSCAPVDVGIYDKILQYLITEKKANINWTAAKWYNNTVLMNCCANGETRICLKLMKEFKASPFVYDTDRKHVLHLLIGKGRSRQQPIIKEILNRADIKDYIDSKMDGGFTPLHLACARGNIFYINHLLEAGASLESKDDNNRTPCKF